MQAALIDCNAALRIEPNDEDILDSRGFVYLRLGEFDKSIADYDGALKIDPRRAHSLYGRGLAKHKKGDAVGATSDIAAAKAIQGDIAEEFARYGVTPASEAVGSVQRPTTTVSTPAADCAQAETHWKSAEDIKTLAVYEDHVARFPDCNFAALAAARIEALKKSSK